MGLLVHPILKNHVIGAGRENYVNFYHANVFIVEDKIMAFPWSL